MKADRIRTLLADVLPRTSRAAGRVGLTPLWDGLRRFYERGRRPVRPRLHGRRLWLNAGNPYPFTLRQFPRFNAGLVATVDTLHARLERPLGVIDVGAAVGDTVALLVERCPRAAGSFWCVDGNAAFADYFRLNTVGIPGVTFHQAMLAAAPSSIPGLVQHHPGTATATGRERIQATTLDQALGPLRAGWDLLKIDVDGYDGEVLAGATGLLADAGPAVYFEWHPRLTREAGNDPRRGFQVLREAGYRSFVWFRNDGPFSHFSHDPAEGELETLAGFLAASRDMRDTHYDVLALPERWREMAAGIALRVGM